MRPVAFTNARIVDPASGYDGPGAIIVTEGVIADVVRGGGLGALSADVEVVDAGGALLIPGLIDVRVKTGEPGAEPKETLKSAAMAAAAGGVTTMVVQPDTHPVMDEPSVVDFILRRARDIELVHVYPAGAATKGCEGKRMAEIGLMHEAGCLYVTDADRPIVDSKVFQRVLMYAKAFDTPVAHRPVDPWLSAGAAATSGEFAARMGLPSVPAVAEKIMLERDLALAELTGARLIVDQITTAAALESLKRAKDRGLAVTATTSINHLSFNEIDIGDYRTFCKLDPPLRSEDDRQAVIEAVASGLIQVVVSAHAPAPAEDKRLPYDEAAPGAVGLQTLLAALLAFHHEGRIPLIDLIRTVTVAPADLLGLQAGRIAKGAPADLVLCDLDAPVRIDADKLVSKSKNSPFDGRRLQGKVLRTVVDGRTVYAA
ncbi:MAG: dihydroorotase [Phenylobacterium sp. RIFCSPHIGHO2_01_FULL_69_31]|jgi:dihydroorotase|uniref:dihydroorotase n=1 Tax=Phenylobacterium sp. RIFCSPHIGHO2_01_FULL_69_31 TaxID=1801944 RepID=UPI0008D4A1E1|nr:dihydroorotase [Phenylobacterium sp. RIFCSPHIGHO2_01_FULL_69_31]OHB30081.1 MAG: dihydroorotase [Phenylobacterium sp. RIFCSPHIGHO2_01_FULL_69_31]